MSSGTSIKDDPQHADAVPAWQLFALAGLVGATFVVFMSRGQSPAAIILLSATIFAAAGVGIGALRTFTPFVSDTPAARGPMGRILAGRTRGALEREKALTLRSIKELEFDFAMGKMSKADFDEMGGRLRRRAVGLMRQLDEGGGYREQIEREVERRLKEMDEGEAPARAKADVSEIPECPECGTANDPDARFCKSCGTRLSAE